MSVHQNYFHQRYIFTNDVSPRFSMCKVVILLVLCCWNFSSLFAQVEIYDEPVRIMDTLERSSNTKKTTEKKSKKEIENERYDALTDIEKKKEKLNRLRIGGNFGFQFGDYTYVNLSPTVGYMAVKERLEVGGGPIFIFQRYRYAYNQAVRSFIYGADVYSRGFVYKGLFLEARYDPVNKPSYKNLSNRLWVHHLLLGAGYAASIGKIGVFNISVLYNVLDNDESIYQGTFSSKVPLIINMGFGFGVGGK
jgi:hypothetical protein